MDATWCSNNPYTHDNSKREGPDGPSLLSITDNKLDTPISVIMMIVNRNYPFSTRLYHSRISDTVILWIKNYGLSDSSEIHP